MAIDREQQSMVLFGDLVRVVHGISAAGARELALHELTPAQYRVRGFVQDRPGCTQQVIGELTGVTKGNVSMVVSRLEARGLVMRARQGAAHALELTDAGYSLLARLRPLHRRFLAKRFEGLSDDDLGRLRDLLAILDRGRS